MSGITVTGGMTFAVNGGGGFTPVTRSYTTGSGSETIPTGASQVVIEVWGAGAGGGRGSNPCLALFGGGRRLRRVC